MPGRLCYDGEQTGIVCHYHAGKRQAGLADTDRPENRKWKAARRSDSLCRIFEDKIIQRKGRDDGMAAFFIEFSKELIELIILAGVSVAAIFCGKKLRDRKDAKTASEQKSN